MPIDSDFPFVNRAVYPMNVAYLNYATISQESVQKS